MGIDYWVCQQSPNQNMTQEVTTQPNSTGGTVVLHRQTWCVTCMDQEYAWLLPALQLLWHAVQLLAVPPQLH